MSRKIKFTVKNSNELFEFLSKFKSKLLNGGTLITFEKDRLVVRSAYLNANFFKLSMLKYSDVFEEPEINIGDVLYLCLFDKVEKMLSNMKLFKDTFSIILNVDTLTESDSISKMSSWLNGATSAELVSSISFLDSNLNITLNGNQVIAIPKCFNLTAETIDYLISADEPNLKLAEFEANKEEIGIISSLITKSNTTSVIDETVTVKSTEDRKSIIFSVDKYFKYKFNTTVELSEDVNFKFPILTMPSVDLESHTVSIIRNPKTTGLVFNSVNTETLAYIAGVISPKKQ